MVLPDPALVVLVGASGSGKSTWAAQRYRAEEVVSSDALRGVVGSGTHDLEASTDAFALLEAIITARLGRRLTTVVDTLGLDAGRRRRWLSAARAAGLAAVRAPVTRSAPVSGWEVTRPGTDRTASTGVEVLLQVSRFPWGEDPLAWLRGVALAADEAGFAGLALMDHLIQIPQVGRAWDPSPDPWVTLGALAALDTRLRLGTLCTPVTFRRAGITAKAAATLSALTGGRAFVGIGAGWWEREHVGFGLPFPPARERLDDLERAIPLMRALWAPGTKPYAGPGGTLPETTCYPRPASPIPVIVGGGGEHRTLRIAAEHGDACNLTSTEPQVLRRKIEVLQRHCAEVGRDASEVAVTVLDVAVVGADRDDVWRRVERHRGRTAAATFAARTHAGTVAQHRDRHADLAGHGVSTVFLSTPDLDGPQDVLDLAGLNA